MSDLFLPSESLQVQPNAGLPMQVPAVGAQVGQSLSQLGEIQTRIYRDHNAVASMQAQNALNEWTTEALYHPQNGTLHQASGLNAPKVVDKTLADYNAQRSKIAAALPNDDARASFDMAADEHANSVRKQLYGYEHAQVTQAANEQSEAYVKNLQNNAVQHLMVQGPPSAQQAADARQDVADDVAKQQAAIRDMCARNGIPQAKCDEMTIAAASGTHLQVIEQLFANSQNATAKEWYQQHKDQLVGQDSIRAANMVRVGTDQDQARAAADSILGSMHAAALDPDGNVDRLKYTEEDALKRIEEAGKGMDTGVYDQMKARVLATLHQESAAHNEVQRNKMQDAYDWMGDENNLFHDIPANVLGSLDRPNREVILKEQARMRKGDEPQTTPGVWQSFLDQSKDPQQWDELLQTKPVDYKPYLSKADFASLEKRYAEVAGQVSKRDTKLSQGMVTDQTVSQLFTTNIGTPPKKAPAGEDQSPEYTEYMLRQQRFSKQLHSLVGAEQVKLKRDLTPPEIEEQANKLFAKQTWQVRDREAEQSSIRETLTYRGLLRETASGPAFEVPGADKRAYSIRDISKEDRARYVEKLQSKGSVVTEARLIQLYNADVTAAAIKADNAAP